MATARAIRLEPEAPTSDSLACVSLDDCLQKQRMELDACMELTERCQLRTGMVVQVESAEATADRSGSARRSDAGAREENVSAPRGPLQHAANVTALFTRSHNVSWRAHDLSHLHAVVREAIAPEGGMPPMSCHVDPRLPSCRFRAFAPSASPPRGRWCANRSRWEWSGCQAAHSGALPSATMAFVGDSTLRDVLRSILLDFMRVPATRVDDEMRRGHATIVVDGPTDGQLDAHSNAMQQDAHPSNATEAHSSSTGGAQANATGGAWPSFRAFFQYVPGVAPDATLDSTRLPPDAPAANPLGPRDGVTRALEHAWRHRLSHAPLVIFLGGISASSRWIDAAHHPSR